MNESDRYVVPWPYEVPQHQVELLAGPFDTLPEAQAVAASSIPKDWPSYR